MPLRRFTRSLLYGAAAGLATAPFLLVVGPVLGPARALALLGVLSAAVYLAVVAPSRGRGLRVAGLALAMGAGLLWTASPSTVLFGSASLLAVLRSGFLYPSRPARSLLVEGALLAAAFAFAKMLAGPSVASLALAVWGFFLVESLFFLLGGASNGAVGDSREDPFDRARREALRLMEDVPM